MTTHFSFIAEDTSNVVERVSKIIHETTEALSEDRATRISRLKNQIQDLESRGFLKRQEFKAPTTGDFERRFTCINEPSLPNPSLQPTPEDSGPLRQRSERRRG